MTTSFGFTNRITAIALAFACATPALAASDYLLEIEGYAGPGKTGSIEVQSWSWGASNPTSIGSAGMGAGKQSAPLAQPLPSQGSLHVITAREAGSGMATGRRCATGTHFPKATLRGPRQSVSLNDVVVSACAANGMTITYGTASPASAESNVVKSKSNITNN